MRPSGTEPKLKPYVEATAPSTEDLDADRAAAATRAEAIEAELLSLVR